LRSLVTGGAGFIGSNLVDALVERGDDVVVLDDLSSGRRENLAEAIAGGAELVEGSITDGDAVASTLGRHRPDAVFHLAAQIDVRRSVTDPQYDLALNVGGTINLLEAARDAGVIRFIFASTGGAIYGEGSGRELPLGEGSECRPEAPYGQSKLSAEGYLALYGRLHGLSGASLRFANVYGPRQDPHGEAGVVAILSNYLLRGEVQRIFDDGLQTRDYVYVGDVIDALLKAASTRVDGPFNIGTGRETTVIELGQRLAALEGRRFEPEHMPPRPGEIRRIALSADRARDELGWTPSVSLDEGLRVTLDSLR